MQKKISKQLINEQYDFVCFELDIAKDVTANTKEVGGNTYNQSIAWVEDVKKIAKNVAVLRNSID